MLTGIGSIDRIYRSADAVVVQLTPDLEPDAAKQFVGDHLKWLAGIAKECDRSYTLITHRGMKPRQVPASMAAE